MPTEVVFTIAPSGGDYTSLSAFDAAEAADLVSADENYVIECESGDYTSQGGGLNFIDDAVSIGSDWTTDATRTLRFVAPTGHRHDGRLLDAGGDYTGFTVFNDTIGESCFSIDDELNVFVVEICADFQAGTGLDGRGFTYTGNGTFTDIPAIFIGCIARSALREGFYAPAIIYAINCLALECVGVSGQGFDFLGRGQSGAGEGSRAYNCTAVNCDEGFAFSMTGNPERTIVRNCLAYGNTLGFDTESGVDVDYCASDDASADDNGGSNNRINQTFTFVDAANDDYHLDAADAGAAGFGVSLASDTDFPFDYDVDGDTRSNWDIGFDEIVASGTTVDLAGTLEGVGDIAGTLSPTRELAGALEGVGDIAGTAELRRALAGTLEGVADAGADMRATFAMRGALAGVADASGTIALELSLAGTLEGVGDITGTLSVEGAVPLLGTLEGVGDIAGTLSVLRPFAGTLAGVGDIAGTLELTTTVGLAGTLAGVAELTGALERRRSFDGTLEGAAAASGTLEAARTFAGTLEGVGTITGRLLIEGAPILSATEPTLISRTPARTLSSSTPARTIHRKRN